MPVVASKPYLQYIFIPNGLSSLYLILFRIMKFSGLLRVYMQEVRSLCQVCHCCSFKMFVVFCFVTEINERITAFDDKKSMLGKKE